MNILITTFALLLVLNIGTALFFTDLKVCKEKIRAASGFFSAVREGQNKLQQKQFSSWNDPRTSALKALEKQAPRTLRTTNFTSHRKLVPPREPGRFHVALLWKAETSVFTQKVLKQFLKELYGHTEWFNEQKIARIVEALKEFGMKNQNSFTQIDFLETLDTDLYTICYHMIKGTQIYDMEKKFGYPPIKDCFDFSICTPKQFCHFPSASIPFLRALLGPELTQKILVIEEEKWGVEHRHRHCIKRELLETVAHSSRSAELINIIESYCYFGKVGTNHTVVEAKEAKTGISVRYGTNSTN